MQVRVCMCMCECGECTWYEGVCTPEPDGLMGRVIARVYGWLHGMAGGLTNKTFV